MAAERIKVNISKYVFSALDTLVDKSQYNNTAARISVYVYPHIDSVSGVRHCDFSADTFAAAEFNAWLPTLRIPIDCRCRCKAAIVTPAHHVLLFVEITRGK